MPTTDNNGNVSATVTAFSAAFIGLCRALEHQKIILPHAIAQEIFLQRNALHNDPDSRYAKKVLENIGKKLEEPIAPTNPIIL